MELLIAYRDDPAGHNMANYLSKEMTLDGDIFRGKYYDLIIIPTPAISADWLEDKYDYDGFVFLSKHAAESGVLALTCHSTGNFSEAKFGGNDRQVAIPHPNLQKQYLQILKKHQSENPVAICFGGTHYPTKFTHELLEGKYALGTVMPKHALNELDEELFSHILSQNKMAKFALLDWRGLGTNKQKILDLLKSTSLEIIKL
jgi:D-aminoacyl-tRNA deacylase